MSTQNNPIASLAQADRTLTSAVHATADQLDRMATTPLDAAFARLDASAVAVRQRLQAGMARLANIVGGVVQDVEADAASVMTALAANLLPAPIAPIPAPTTAPADDDLIDLSGGAPILTTAANSPAATARDDRRPLPTLPGKPGSGGKKGNSRARHR